MFKNRAILLSMLIVLAVNVFIYSKSAGYDLVSLDDPRYIQMNPLIKGLDGGHLKRIFTEPYFANYQPLVLLTYAANYRFGKDNPKGYHLTNIFFHTMNGLFVLILIYLITESPLISLMTALLFSLHPMQVESVAWVSELKGLMCAFFYFISFITYILYSRGKKRGLNYLSIAMFLLALLSKPMAVTFPVILLLFDYYEEKLSKSRFIEKIPYFALSLIFSIVTMLVQKGYGAVKIKAATPHFKNFILAFYNLAFYIGKIFVPVKMSAKYERTPAFFRAYSSSDFFMTKEFFIAILIIAALIAYIFNFKKLKREVNFGILFFLISLIPILRFIPIGDTFAADRYVYIPIIGLFFAIIMIFKSYEILKPVLKKVFIAAVFVYISYLGTATHFRLNVWESSRNLWYNVLTNYPHSFMALEQLAGDYFSTLLNLGNSYLEKKDLKKARSYYLFIAGLKFEGIKKKAVSRGMSESFFKIAYPYSDFLDARKSAILNLGISYLHENNISEAQRIFTTLSGEYPDDKDLKNQIENIYRGL